MPKLVRSARGEMIDFDLMQIQQQLADTPVHADVQARQDFVDRRLRRRVRRVPTPPPKLRSEEPDVSPKLPGTENTNQLQTFIDEAPEPIEVPEQKPTVTQSRQKARPKTKTPETETENKE